MNARTKIYVKINSEKNEIVYSGIRFVEFIKYLPKPIENLLIMKGNYAGDRNEHNFELLEGEGSIAKFTLENRFDYGDFCFVDYTSPQNMGGLSQEQIAELLYLGHMFIPLHLPFFESLNNRFVYLSHDDGWYGKLYCWDMQDFIAVLCRKVISIMSKGDECEILETVKKTISQLAEQGVLIDLDEFSQKNHSINIYVIGSHSNMDDVFNNCQILKNNASQIRQMVSHENVLIITEDIV